MPLLGGGLLIRPATKISQLAIDADKNWEPWLATSHSPAWATGLSSFSQRKKFSLYGTTRPDWYDVNWLYRKQISFRHNDADGCTGGTASASSENVGGGEGAAQAFDNNFTGSKWLALTASAWIKYDLGAGNEKIVTSYTITSGNDAASRDPMSWGFEGSNDDLNWTVLDTRVGQTWSTRLQTKAFGPFVNTTAYRYYRLNVTANYGSTLLQIEELEFCQATPNLENFQYRLRLTRSTGTDIAGQIFLDTDVLATFDDIRFTEEDGVTPVPFWVEGVSGADCWVYVKLPRIPCRIYLYYGNAAAASASNGTDTFIFFDDFSGDLSKWGIVPAGWSIVGGKCRSVGAGAMQATVVDAIRDNVIVECTLARSTDTNQVRRLRFNDDMSANYCTLWENHGSNNIQLLKSPGDIGGGSIAFAMVANTTYRFALAKFNGVSWRSYADTWAVGAGFTTRDTEVGWMVSWETKYFQLVAESADQTDWDNVLIRNFAETWPTAGISSQREIQTLPTTLYPMKLVVHYGSGTNDPWNVYMDSLCYPDFRDLRFTNNAGTKLHYFIDYYADSDYANMWILFDTVPGAGAITDFWIYYGNSSATSESNRTLAFPLFADGPDSGVLDAAKWSALSGTWDVGSTTDHWGIARNAIRQTNAAAALFTLQALNNILGDNVALDCWSKGTNTATMHGPELRSTDTNNYYAGCHGGFNHEISVWKNVAGVPTELTSLVGTRNTNWHLHSFRVNGARLTYIQDSYDPYVANDTSHGAAVLKSGLFAGGAAGSIEYFTDIRIRPSYYQEPIFGGWAAAEIYETYYGIENVVALANDDYSGWASGLSAYTKRKMFTVTGSTTGAVSNYQIKLQVAKMGGGGIGNSVFLGGYCRNDFNDIRFVNAAGTPIDYWIESYVSGVMATVWVELDFVPISPGTADFWIYYNNPAAASGSDGPGTFITWRNGTANAAWSNENHAGLVTETGTVLRFSSAGNADWWDGGVNNAPRSFCNVNLFGLDFRVYAKLISPADCPASTIGVIFISQTPSGGADTFKNTIVRGDSAGEKVFYQKFGGAEASDAVAPTTTYLRIVKNGGNYNFDYSVNGSNWINKGTPAEAYNPLYVGMAAKSWGGNPMQYDFEWFFLAPYIYPEPTITVWGGGDMEKGDILIMDGTKLIKLSPGSIGTNLIAHDPLNLLTWEYPP